MLRILHICTNMSNGGAAIAAFRIHRELRNRGFESLFLVLRGESEDNSVVKVKLKTGISRWGFRLFKRVEKLISLVGFGINRDPRSFGLLSVIDSKQLHQTIQKINPDILHLHWVGDYFLTINDIARFKKPLVWSLHDMWPFLGTEHLVSQKQSFLDQLILKQKAKTWKSLLPKLHAVAPSQWMLEMAKQSSLFQKTSVEVIPNSVDTRLFNPVDRNEARRFHGLPENARVLFFCAALPFLEPIKGYDFFMSVVEAVQRQNPHEQVIAVTCGSSKGTRSPRGVQHRHFEFNADQQYLNTLYSSADALVVTSKIESFGLVAAEAMACGTPVVCFDVAGLKDVVEHKVTGYRARYGDVVDLANGIKWVFSEAKGLNQRSRQRAENLFDVTRVTDLHLELYEKVISTS